MISNMRMPPVGETGGANSKQQHLDDSQPISIAPADVEISLLLDDIGAAIGPLEAQIACLATMVAAGDSTGVVYVLRRLKAHWRVLDQDARDLIATDAERLSAIRQQAEASQ